MKINNIQTYLAKSVLFLVSEDDKVIMRPPLKIVKGLMFVGKRIYWRN